MSVAELADLSGTSRAAIMDYELGLKRPRVDTADRILMALGRRLVDVSLPRVPDKWQPVQDVHAVDSIRRWQRDPKWAVAEAHAQLPSVLESHAAAERLDLRWGEVLAIVDGRTVAADPLDVLRARHIVRAATAAMTQAGSDRRPRLRSIANDTLVTENITLPPLQGALDFLARAVSAGDDPALTLCSVNGALLAQGYPWLFPPFKAVSEYRRALVVCSETGDAGPLTRILAGSANEKRFAA